MLVVRISRVQRVARPRADASSTRNLRRSTPQSGDREANGCDASAAGFLNGISTDLRSADRKVRRGLTQRQAFRVRSHQASFTGCLGGGPRPAGLPSDRVWQHMRFEWSECAEHEADAIVPEGDASESFYLARDRKARRRDVRGWSEFRERLFQLTRRGGSAGESERMPASKPIDRSGWR